MIPDGIAIEYDSVYITSFVDEGGELKILDAKDFSDPEKCGRFNAEVIKILTKGGPVAVA